MLGDDLADAMPELQAQAESAMRTPCQIRRPTGVTPDPTTGADVPTYAPTPIYQGRCKIQDHDLQVTSEQVANSTAIVARPEVHIPVSAGPVQVGDEVQTFAADDTTYSTPLRSFRVAGLHQKTWQTAQRLPVEELS